MNDNFFTQNEAKINGRAIWHYLIHTPIGQINVVQTENSGGEIIGRKIFDGNYDKAESYYNNLCKKVLNNNI